MQEVVTLDRAPGPWERLLRPTHVVSRLRSRGNGHRSALFTGSCEVDELLRCFQSETRRWESFASLPQLEVYMPEDEKEGSSAIR